MTQKLLSAIKRRGARLSSASPAPEDRQLLSAADFTYLGAHEVARSPGYNSLDVFNEGLTHRYVDGQLRFMFAGFRGNGQDERYRLKEIVLNGFGQQPTTVGDYGNLWDAGTSTSGTGTWKDNDTRKSIWWDEEDETLWTGSGFDYPQGAVSPTMKPAIYGRKVPSTSGQPCTNHTGWFGVDGIGQRALWGKLGRIPSWFRTRESLPEYMVIGGGYTSLMGQGLGPSMGPMFVAIPDFNDYTPIAVYQSEVANIPSEDVKILADHRPGAFNRFDWYGVGYESRTYDRGVRVTPIDNYFDDGDDRQNPSTRPDFPPVEGAQWLSPAPGDPNGWGRWVWGDFYGGSGNWIDNNAGTRSRHGIICVLKCAAVAGWYQTSAVVEDSETLELHIFDPEDLALVNVGSASPHLVRPSSIIDLSSLMPSGGYNKVNNASATFDATTNTLYILATACSGKDTNGVNLRVLSLMHVFKVGGGI